MKINFNNEDLYIRFVSSDQKYVLVSKKKEIPELVFKIDICDLVDVDLDKLKKFNKKGKKQSSLFLSKET